MDNPYEKKNQLSTNLENLKIEISQCSDLIILIVSPSMRKHIARFTAFTFYMTIQYLFDSVMTNAYNCYFNVEEIEMVICMLGNFLAGFLILQN